MKVIKPKRLQKGDRVAIVSPSYAVTTPKRFNQSLIALRQFGLEPVLMPHTLGKDEELFYLSASAKDRANDLNQAFADSSIKAILCTIGGENCIALLPFLDFDLIKNNPKVFMGFSDITILTLAIFQKTGLVTFHGPNLLYAFGSFLELPFEMRKSLVDLLFEGKKVTYQSVEKYNDIGLSSEDMINEKMDLPKIGASWPLLRKGEACGRLIGGNLEIMQHLRGTAYWPIFHDAIFFWEEVGESISTIQGYLTRLELEGIFKEISGMIVGKIAGKSETWEDQPEGFGWKQEIFEKMLLRVTKGYGFPILTEVDLGHTRPMLVMPIGIKAEINKNGTIKLLENPVV